MQTTYSIMFGNPSIYNDQLYPKDFSAFENYSPLGTAIIDKNESELRDLAAEMGLEVPPTVGTNSTFTPKVEESRVNQYSYNTPTTGGVRTPVKY